MSEFKNKVNELVSQMEQTDDGKWQLPTEAAADIDEATLYAVTAERRYRDTQGAYTRSQQEAKKQAAMANALEEHILANSDIPLNEEERSELDLLKTSDPEAWREKLNVYEQRGKSSISDNLAKIRSESAQKGELEIREEQMAAWSEQTGIELTNDVVQNDIPPRMTKKLENGDITFDEFLIEVGAYLQANKVIQTPIDSEIPSLGDVAGGSAPSDEANEADFAAVYEKTVF